MLGVPLHDQSFLLVGLGDDVEVNMVNLLWMFNFRQREKRERRNVLLDLCYRHVQQMSRWWLKISRLYLVGNTAVVLGDKIQ